MSNPKNIIDENAHTFSKTKLCIRLTNKKMLAYDKWNNKKLLNLLKDKLAQHNKIKSLPMCTNEQCNKSLHFTIHSGVYNECVLLELKGKGITTNFSLIIYALNDKF